MLLGVSQHKSIYLNLKHSFRPTAVALLTFQQVFIHLSVRQSHLLVKSTDFALDFESLQQRVLD
jgi:hypothetical protein